MKGNFKPACWTAMVLCLAALKFSDRCDADTVSTLAANSSGVETTAPKNVRSITLPHFEPEMPPAPGRGDFLVVCESCHSSRYVTMQPPFPQKQWEETVSKMTKTYGAQMDEEQQKAIVGYLTAINGNVPGTSTGAAALGDEESGSPSALPVQPSTSKSPLIKPATNAAELAADLSRGAELFRQNCTACHGNGGFGDGPVAQVLWRKPANLVATRFTTECLSQILWNGVRGTSMPSWRALSKNDLKAIAAYVQALHPPPREAGSPRKPGERARNLFRMNCAPCHGLLGDGQSALAATLNPPPANFTCKQPDQDLIRQVLREGIQGTAMPSWQTPLSEADRETVAEFVRSLFHPVAGNLN